MTLTFNEADWDDLCQQAPTPQADNLMSDDFEEVMGVPESLGRGYACDMELSPGIWLSFSDCEHHRDFRVKVPVHEHPIQLDIQLSGFIYFDAVHPNLGGTCSYFSGSGISPAYVEKYRGGERLTTVGVEIEPDWLASFLLEDKQYDSNKSEAAVQRRGLEDLVLPDGDSSPAIAGSAALDGSFGAGRTAIAAGRFAGGRGGNAGRLWALGALCSRVQAAVWHYAESMSSG